MKRIYNQRFWKGTRLIYRTVYVHNGIQELSCEEIDFAPLLFFLAMSILIISAVLGGN